ncbi:MAG: hypothetical protein O2968_08055 [Acidobacteria bacterium]|nr:hypothetical protein [Acidobacteriota bacterium]
MALYSLPVQYPPELRVRVFSAFDGDGGGGGFFMEYGFTDSLQLEAAVGPGSGKERAAEGEFGPQWSLLNLGDSGIHVALGLKNEDHKFQAVLGR